MQVPEHEGTMRQEFNIKCQCAFAKTSLGFTGPVKSVYIKTQHPKDTGEVVRGEVWGGGGGRIGDAEISSL